MFKNFINLNSLSLTKRIFFFMFFLLVITLVITSIMVFYNNKEVREKNKLTRLAQKENQINEAFMYLLTSNDITAQNSIPIIEKRLFEISDINDTHLNIYDISGNLKLSTEGVILPNSKKLSTDLLKKIKKNKYVVINYHGNTENESFLSNFFYVQNHQNQPVAIVSIPYFYDDVKEKKEFDELVIKFIFLLLFLIIISGILAWYFSNSVTNKLKDIANKIKHTQMFGTNEMIDYEANDEVKVLVTAYNQMLNELQEQKTMIRFRNGKTSRTRT